MRRLLLLWIMALTSIDVQAQQGTDQKLVDELSSAYSAAIAKSQYMRQDCKPSAPDESGWAGFPVQRCAYTSKQLGISVSTTADLLFPSVTQLTSWTINACVDAKVKDVRACVGKLAFRVLDASNGQFPVAGYVVEPPMDKGWKYPNEPYCYLFRDGVTVTTASWPDTSHQLKGKCGPESANLEPVRRALLYGRISSVSREAYLQAGGKEKVGTAEASSPEWANAVGVEFRKAWMSDRNFLLYASARYDINANSKSIWK